MDLSIEELISRAQNAIQSEDHSSIIEYLRLLKHRLQGPQRTQFALNHGLCELSRSCLSCGIPSVRDELFPIISTCLLTLSPHISTHKYLFAAKALIRFLFIEFLNVAIRNLTADVFDVFSQWCSKSRVHRDILLEVFPLSEVENLNIYNYPSDTVLSLVRFICETLNQGRHQKNLLQSSTVLFYRIVQGNGNNCSVAKQICETLTEMFDTLRLDVFPQTIIDSNLTDSLVRHVTISHNCERHCLEPMLSLFSKFLCTDSKSCLAFIDQGALVVVGVALREDHQQLFGLVSRTLASVFAYTPEHIHFALKQDLLLPLFFLREHPDENVRKEARIALNDFLLRSSTAQLCDVIEADIISLLAKFTRSQYEDVVSDSLRWFFIVISTTRSVDPVKLASLHEEMQKNGVGVSTSKLLEHPAPDIRKRAMALFNFMTKEFFKSYPSDIHEETEAGGS